MKGNAKQKNGSKNKTASSASKRRSEKTNPEHAHNGREMDAVELLIKDHENVQELFAQAEQAGEDAQKKAMLFEKISDELQVHTRIEEEIFYPAVADLPVDRAKDDIERSLQDHEEVDDLLDDLEMLSPEDSDFDERMSELVDAVRKHIKLEQEEVFKVARTGLGEEKLQELGREMEQLKQSLQEEKMDSEGAEASE
jgi:hemerythrin-like domain-containing protein